MISIVTVTQLSRKETLKLTAEYISYQTVKELIKEWIIVEGSKSEEDAKKNKVNIDKLRDMINISIIYVPYIPSSTIGMLRNRCNEHASSEYIVCMDDDDYYSENYVQQHLFALKNNTLSGISETCMYEFYLGKSYRFKVIKANFSLNCSLGYTLAYAKTHKYDENLNNAEEDSFLSYGRESMSLIDHKCMCLNSYGDNTYNKRQLVFSFHLSLYKSLEEYECIIPQKYLNKYNEIFNIYNDSPYDIVYFCGNSVKFGINGMFDAKDKNFGGSEQSVIYLAEEWAKSGYKVAVYGNVDECEINGITFINYLKFNFLSKFKVLILWRLMGLVYSSLAKELKGDRILLDIHDNPKFSIEFFLYFSKLKEKINFFLLKSEFHKRNFLQHVDIGTDNVRKCQIIPNGIRKTEFDKYSYLSYKRDVNKFIYASCYTRGLDKILKYIWPGILAANPLAELYICYGMHLIEDKNYKEYLYSLIGKSTNIMNLDRIGIERIAKLKNECAWHLYVTNDEREIDCISIRESLYTGCIPIISDKGVFAERGGMVVSVDFNDEKTLIMAGNTIGVSTSSINEDQFNKMVKQLKGKDKTMISWEEVSKRWSDLFLEKKNVKRKDLEDHLINLALTVSIPKEHVSFLQKLKNQNIYPKVIYDIGSNVLHWTTEASKIWDAKIILFEAMKECEFMYKNYDYFLGILSKEDGEDVKWYQNEYFPGGNSYYKEIGHENSQKLYPENSYELRKTFKLDTVVKEKGYPYPDLIKIDTQGSEIDILKGATEVLKHVKYMIIELQHTEYNRGAMLAENSIKEIENMGFICKDRAFTKNNYDGDYFFIRKDLTSA
jgi:FkbM family methyltransferase